MNAEMTHGSWDPSALEEGRGRQQGSAQHKAGCLKGRRCCCLSAANGVGTLLFGGASLASIVGGGILLAQSVPNCVPAVGTTVTVACEVGKTIGGGALVALGAAFGAGVFIWGCVKHNFELNQTAKDMVELGEDLNVELDEMEEAAEDVKKGSENHQAVVKKAEAGLKELEAQVKSLTEETLELSSRLKAEGTKRALIAQYNSSLREALAEASARIAKIEGALKGELQEEHKKRVEEESHLTEVIGEIKDETVEHRELVDLQRQETREFRELLGRLDDMVATIKQLQRENKLLRSKSKASHEEAELAIRLAERLEEMEEAHQLLHGKYRLLEAQLNNAK